MTDIALIAFTVIAIVLVAEIVVFICCINWHGKVIRSYKNKKGLLKRKL